MNIFSFLYEKIETYIDISRIDEILNKILNAYHKVFPISYKYAILNTIIDRNYPHPHRYR